MPLKRRALRHAPLEAMVLHSRVAPIGVLRLRKSAGCCSSEKDVARLTACNSERGPWLPGRDVTLLSLKTGSPWRAAGARDVIEGHHRAHYSVGGASFRTVERRRWVT